MSANLSFLRDPIWQSIGVFVVLLSSLGAMPFLHSENREVVAVRVQGATTEDWFPSDTFALVDRQTKQESSNIGIEYLYIESAGNKAIRPEDIVEPITLFSRKATVVAIGDCAPLLELPSGKTVIHMRWHKDNGNWKAEQTLLNPNDIACASIFYDRSKKDGVSSSLSHGLEKEQSNSAAFSYTELDDITVTARIADARFRYFNSTYDYALEQRWSKPKQWLQVFIVFVGWQAYIFLFVQIALFATTYVVAQAATFLEGNRSSALTRLVLIVVLSTATAEVLTSFLNFSFDQIHPVSWLILAGHALFMGVLAVRLFSLRRE